MKIRGLNLHGTPWACSGLLRDDLYFYLLRYIINEDNKTMFAVVLCSTEHGISYLKR